jgi:hypothetical protein
MPTLPTPELFAEILDDTKTIPEETLAYFRRRLRLYLHEMVVDKFYQREDMNQADLARRIGKRPEVINRLLGAPGNWTLDTVSDLLIAMKAVPAFGSDDVERILAEQPDDSELAQMLKSPPPSNVTIPQLGSGEQSPKQGGRRITL